MTLPSSGAISLSQIRSELGVSGAISLNDENVRLLAGKPGLISLGDFYGKSSSVLVGFNFGTIESKHSSQSGCTSMVMINTDGSIVASGGSGGGTQTWKSSEGLASEYQVYCQYNSGDTLNNSDAANTWLTLSTPRLFGISSGGVQPARQGSYTLKIRKISNTLDEVSDTFTLRTGPL